MPIPVKHYVVVDDVDGDDDDGGDDDDDDDGDVDDDDGDCDDDDDGDDDDDDGDGDGDDDDDGDGDGDDHEAPLRKKRGGQALHGPDAKVTRGRRRELHRFQQQHGLAGGAPWDQVLGIWLQLLIACAQ